MPQYQRLAMATAMRAALRLGYCPLNSAPVQARCYDKLMADRLRRLDARRNRLLSTQAE